MAFSCPVTCPPKPGSSKSTSTTTSAPPVLFGPRAVAGDMPPATGFREAKEKRALLFLFQPPASEAVPEQLIVEEK